MRRYVFTLLVSALALGVLVRGPALRADAAAATGARLTAISSTLDGSRTTVLIEASAPVAYHANTPDASTLVVDLRNVVPTGYANGFVRDPRSPVRGVDVNAVEGPDGEPVSRVRVALDTGSQVRVRSQRNLILVEVQPAATGTATPARAPAPAPRRGERPVARPLDPAPARQPVAADPLAALLEPEASDRAPREEPPQAATPRATRGLEAAQGGTTTINSGQRTSAREFTGHPVSLDFQGADLRAVLRTFAEISGLNIVIDPAVQGSVDVALRDVPWDQALDIILRANKLGYFLDGTIVRVAPMAVLADEEKQRRLLSEEQSLSGDVRVVTKTLSYARAEDVTGLLTKSALTSRGTVQVDPRTNTLIISDLPAALDTATELLAVLDRPQPQVEIEARIVQTSQTFLRDVGVTWGISGEASPRLGNTLPLAFPNSVVAGGTTGGVIGTPAVNLGVEGASSAIGLALGAINGSFNLDLALSALERTGRGRVLSTPRVSTQNNQEAEITQGVQIPIQTVANNTVTVTFKDAALTLKVTPQITASNTVILKISVENAQPDFSRSVNGIPPIDTQRANTQVLVSDGQTTVIGGIYLRTEQNVNDRTPTLHRLPLLGWMFRKDRVEDGDRELLIFITPRILRT
jgi:type IV pilus assembly protein PilQ